jgi:hypothetical protein
VFDRLVASGARAGGTGAPPALPALDADAAERRRQLKLSALADGSIEGTGKVAGFHGLQHAGNSNDGFATKLDAIPEGDGTLLDYTLMRYGSGMHAGDHNAQPLPIALIGGGRAGMRTDQLVDFSAVAAGRPLRDLYFTILNGYFGLNVASFGTSLTTPQNKLMEEILA